MGSYNECSYEDFTDEELYQELNENNNKIQKLESAIKATYNESGLTEDILFCERFDLQNEIIMLRNCNFAINETLKERKQQNNH